MVESKTDIIACMEASLRIGLLSWLAWLSPLTFLGQTWYIFGGPRGVEMLKRCLEGVHMRETAGHIDQVDTHFLSIPEAAAHTSRVLCHS